MRYLTFALGKGRLANKTLELFEKVGITCEEMKDKDSRKLIFVNEELKLRFFLSKGPDVPTYVEYGAADIGVVGKDTILEEGRKVLANGNLYVFELDEQKVNPYYLQAFFASDAGQKLLSKFVVGSTIPNLPLQDFKKAVIPLPPMEIQNKIADEYAATIDEINVIKMKLERAKRKLKESFDKGREG